MNQNQCVKNGATVLLTGECIEAHGDLFYIHTARGQIALVLHCSDAPFVSIPPADIEKVWPERFDAVFDTSRATDEEFIFIDAARVMVCGPEISHVSKRIELPDGVVGEREMMKQDALTELLAWALSPGVKQ